MKDVGSIKERLERHFKDAVDIDLVIQEGKLWITNMRVAKRTNRANLKIAIDLYRENIISENEAISKIQFEDIKETLNPFLKNKDELKFISKGLPASPGIATGKLFFFHQNIVDKQEKNSILCIFDGSPETVSAFRMAQAIIATRGGMTSHAALVARGMGKPCVSAAKDLQIVLRENIAIVDHLILKEGDWITVDGNKGYIYLGKGKFVNPIWRENKDLYLLHRVIEKVICENSANIKEIGKIWLIRDFFLHNVPFEVSITNKKNVRTQKYVSFKHPNPEIIKKYYALLTKVPSNYQDIKLVIIGLRNTLLRQLGNKVGIGKHYKYYKPILDPMLCIKYPEGENAEQLIGEEYFNISKYLPNYIDIYKVRIYFQVQIEYEKELSFLDYTNIKGESIILNSSNIDKVYLEINDQTIDIKELPHLYNIFRKREYFWTWYNENLTTHKEMIDFLNKPKRERIKNYRMNVYAHELELIENNLLTKSGKSLIFKNHGK